MRDKSWLLLLSLILFVSLVTASPPTINSLILNSSLGLNTTVEDLTCNVNITDIDGDPITNKFQWFETSPINFNNVAISNNCPGFMNFSYSPNTEVNSSTTLRLYLTDTSSGGGCDFNPDCWNNAAWTNVTYTANSPTSLSPTINTLSVSSTNVFTDVLYDTFRGGGYITATVHNNTGGSCQATYPYNITGSSTQRIECPQATYVNNCDADLELEIPLISINPSIDTNFPIYLKDNTFLCGSSGNCWNNYTNATISFDGGSFSIDTISTNPNPFDLTPTQNLEHTQWNYTSDTRGCFPISATLESNMSRPTCTITYGVRIEPYWQNESTLNDSYTNIDSTYSCLVNATDGEANISQQSNNLTIVPIFINSCQSLTTEGQYYQLNDTINFSIPSGACIALTNNSITLDCAGHAISGNVTGTGIFEASVHDSIIKNCVLKNLEAGYVSSATNYSLFYNNTIENMSSISIFFNAGSTVTQIGTRIINNTLIGSQAPPFGTGIGSEVNTQDSLIEGNTFIAGGWVVGFNLTNTTIRNNIFSNSLVGGGGGSTNLSYINKFTMTNNSFVNMGNISIFFQNFQFTDLLIQDNSFFDSTFAGTISGFGLITFSHNLSSGNINMVNSVIDRNNFTRIELTALQIDMPINT